MKQRLKRKVEKVKNELVKKLINYKKKGSFLVKRKIFPKVELLPKKVFQNFWGLGSQLFF